ncbi:MAG TPA: ABC transporter permease [Candidatus Binataceae bacterium]|nr:ABC transporter permease [Candidatus Binataceae bacterium]
MKLVTLAKPLGALAAAAAIISLVLLALGASPAGVFFALCDGAFGNWLAFTDTLVKSTPLLFCGLNIAIAFEGALWNIGADGQLLIGALLAGACGPLLGGWPHGAAIFVMLAVGALGGGAWAAIAGWLRARRDVNEVISTIMLNYVAAQILSWAVHGPLIQASRAYPKSAPIAPPAELHLYFPPSRLHLGMLLAVILALACYGFLFYTEAGFELRAMGRNRRASAFFGIRTVSLTLWAMALSGALAGIGGAVHVAAITHRLYETMSPGWGYEAIAVALVARLNPLAIVPTAVLFGALDNGAQAMQRAQGISPVLVQVIEGLVIMILLAFDAAASAALRDTFWGTPATEETDNGPTEMPEPTPEAAGRTR